MPRAAAFRLLIVAFHVVGAFTLLALPTSAEESQPSAFFQTHCVSCHGAEKPEGELNLQSVVDNNATNTLALDRWIKIYDRIESGRMPPATEPRPEAAKVTSVLHSLGESIRTLEKTEGPHNKRGGLRRLTRGEFENTIRDLFDMPGIALQGELPTDGSAHGFDKNSDALDISHVNIAKYIAAADHTLNLAIATQPTAPQVQKRRISLVNSGGFVAHVVGNGDGVLLKNKQPDPDFPPAGEYSHIDEGAHNQIGSFSNGASVGLFRHEDESLSPYFIDHVTIYPARYRVRTSLWSFQWDQGKVLPSRGTEAARLSVVQLTGDGRGGQHPSYVLGYFDAPSIDSQEHEVVTWLNHNELIGFNVASLAPVANYSRKGRAMAFTGPGIACDWLDIEGPLYPSWPPPSHQLLFGELPLKQFKPEEHATERPPQRLQVRQLSGRNRPDPVDGLWTVSSDNPLADAERLLHSFLPRAFRRPVEPDVQQAYVAKVQQRLSAGDCFETAMRWAYRAALCSPEFLYHVEPTGQTVDDHALACRLSYFLWNSLPDDELTQLAKSGTLHEPEVLRGQVTRLLGDAKSQRFIDDFLGQWLKLRQIAANDPDKKLYPEFGPYLQDSMVAESRAYFRELIEKDLNASQLIRSDFAMLNGRLAAHYGIEGVSGSQMRRVDLPAGCPRGSFLTQAAVLKVTANGTTTSPVPRGAFVMARLLGEEPEPPPPNIPAIEPDVRGAQTIREQLAKHREHSSCAACHAKMDPPGFALEAFDVIGGQRQRYRSIGEGDPAPRGVIDPFIGIGFKLGPAVDASGTLPDGRAFANVGEFQTLLASDTKPLLTNLARQLAVYATGRPISFTQREHIAEIVDRTQQHGGGVRTLIHELAQSSLFKAK